MRDGVLTEAGLVVEFDTSQPAPSQWVATGRIAEASPAATSIYRRCLLVGTGTTEEAAIGDLQRRVALLRAAAATETRFVTEWAHA